MCRRLSAVPFARSGAIIGRRSLSSRAEDSAPSHLRAGRGSSDASSDCARSVASGACSVSQRQPLSSRAEDAEGRRRRGALGRDEASPGELGPAGRCGALVRIRHHERVPALALVLLIRPIPASALRAARPTLPDLGERAERRRAFGEPVDLSHDSIEKVERSEVEDKS